MSIWDDPELAQGGEFVAFENVGDHIAGVVQVVRIQTFDDGKRVPQLLIVADDGEDRTITAGQARLKAKLLELRPEAGDHIAITMTDLEKRSGGKTLKHFDVQLRRGGSAGAPAVVPAPYTPPSTSATVTYPQPVAPAPEPTAPPIDPVAAAAALAALTPEQRHALGLA